MALQRGDTGPLVLAAQVLLRVPRTGTFDAITELAVVQLQQKFGLPVNGILDTAEYTAARHASSHETAGADPINPSAITGAPWVLKAGDTMTGGLTLSDGANLTLSGANALGEGNIVMAAAASAAFDTNLVISDSTAKTMGFICGGTPGFVSANGPFFGLRGNTYAAYPNQRGNIFLYGGRPSAPGSTEGRVAFGTNDQERLGIAYNGAVAINVSLAIGSGGTAITKRKVYTPSLVPALVSAGAPVEQTFYIIGLSTSDTVSVNAPAMAVFSARVSAADTLAITFFPPAAGSYTPPSGVYRVLADRS